MEKTEEKSANTILFSFAALSLVYVCVCIFLLGSAKSCSPDSFWQIGIDLTCLSANEIGDFFAGVFAPLAFLWLIAAVIIQSKELKAQRQELSLTRDEMVATRETLSQQAAEMKASTAFIGIQTKIAEQQHETRLKEIKDQQYEKLKNVIFDYLINFKFIKVGSVSELTGNFNHLANISINGKTEILKELISRTLNFRERVAEDLANKGSNTFEVWCIDSEGANYIRDLLNVIEQINVLKGEISKNSFIDYQFHQFEALHTELQRVLSDHTLNVS
jgi:hypothetical protein